MSLATRIGAWLLTVLGVFVVVGCRDRSDEIACADASEQADWTEAQAACQRTWQNTGDPESGYLWARAAARLGDISVAQAIIEDLDGRSVASARTRYVLGFELRGRGHAGDAEEQFLVALSVFEEHGDVRRAAAVARAITLIRRVAGRYADAESMALANLALAERSGDERLVFEGFLELAALHSEQGRIGLAVWAQDRALAVLPNDALSLGVRADRARDAGRTEMAEALYRRASAQLAERGDWKTRRIVALDLVDLALLRHDIGAAGDALAIAVDARQRFTNDAALEDLSPNVRSSALYYAASVALAGGEVDAAQALLVKARGQPLGADWPWQIELVESKIHAARGDDRNALASALSALDAPAAEPSDGPFEAEDRIRRRRDAVAVAAESAHALGDVEAMLSLIERLHLQRPAAREGAGLDAVEDALGERDALAYVAANDAVFRVVRTGEGWTMDRIELSAEERKQQVASFVADLESGAGGRLAAQLLPREVHGRLGASVVIVPDGELESVPWAALPLDGRRLIERFDVLLAPSLRPVPPMRAREAAVFVTDPEGDLPRARAEGSLWAPRLLGTEFSGAAARQDRLEGLRTELLHLALHSGHTDGTAWISLADGRLSARMLAGMEIGAQTVVLVTCASTTTRNGDIWTSIPGAFLSQGSNLVVGTLWSVSDTSAERFVHGLYGRRGLPSSAADVSAAQRELLRGEVHPREWAGYVAMGYILERNENAP